MMNIEQFTGGENSLPGMISDSKNNGVITSEKYTVKCYLANLTDLTQLLELERILTKSLDGKDIVVIDKDKYSFQDRYYVVVTYLEKRNAN